MSIMAWNISVYLHANYEIRSELPMNGNQENSDTYNAAMTTLMKATPYL